MPIPQFVLPRSIALVLAALALLFTLDLFALGAHGEAQRAADALGQRILALQQLQGLPGIIVDMRLQWSEYLLTGASKALQRYRSDAEGFAGAVRRAAVLVDGDDAQRERLAAAGALTERWLERYASPLVIKRGAGEPGPANAAQIRSTLHDKGEALAQVERILAQLGEAIRAEDMQVAAARADLDGRLRRAAAWMRARAFALLVALAALTLMLGRTLARLTGQTRSRKIAETSARTSSATLRAISDAAPLGVFLTDASGACIQSNAAFQRIAGLSADAAQGKGWQSTLHPEDHDRVAVQWDSAVAAGAPFASVQRFVHRNGKVVQTSMRSAAMREDGRVTGFACSVEDVSARHAADQALRDSEDRLHLALQSARLALFDWHVPSGEVFLSREWNAVSGRDVPSPTTARRLNDLVHPSDREPLRAAIIAAFKAGTALEHLPLRMQVHGGQWRQVHCTARVTQRDAAGRAVRMTGTIAAA
ncbi:MAG TPA: PAS domain-containing protein [Burkholderiales bacterium]|nr:PAS domain-containing protein [Burkholderiales bacterium]